MASKIEKAVFYLLLFTIPFQTRVFLYSARAVEGFNEWQSIFLYGTDVLIAVLFVLWFVRCFRGRKIPNNKSQNPNDQKAWSLKFVWNLGFGNWSLPVRIVFLLLFTFILAAGISIFFSPFPIVGVYRWLKLVEMAGLFFYVGSIMKRVSFSRVLAALGAGGIFQGVVAIGQFLAQHSLGLRFLGEPPLMAGKENVAEFVAFGARFMRAYGTTPSPNVLAAFLTIALLALVTWFLLHSERRPGQFLFAAGGAAVIAIGLLFTFSRLLIVIATFSLLLYFGVIVSVRSLRKHLRKALALLAPLGVTALTFGALYWREIYGRFWDYQNHSDLALAERAFFNRVAGQFIALNPNGIGPGNFTLVMRDVMSGLREGLYQPVHNIYLLIAAEAGSVALAVFLGFVLLLLVFALKRLIKNWHIAHLFVVTSFAFILTSGFFDHFHITLQQGSLIFWVVAGMIYYGKVR